MHLQGKCTSRFKIYKRFIQLRMRFMACCGPLIICKHEKGLSKHEKGLSDLNHIKMYREYITKGSKSC